MRVCSSLLSFSICLAVSNTGLARDIYVAKNGQDSNNGTISSPYRTLGKAATVAAAGDTVYIRAGTYEETLRPANSGTAGNRIVFRSYGNEKVVISAMQAVRGWTVDRGQVYRTTVNWDLGQENFVMNRDTVLDLARWPNNTDADPYTINAVQNSGGSGENVITNAYLDYNAGLPNMNWQDGGSIFYYGGGGWLAWKAFIKSATNTRLFFDLNKNPSWIRTAHEPSNIGSFFLEGTRAALDYQNEWYFNSNTNTLFVQLPGGAAPVDGEIKFRRREVTINLHNRNYIEIRNLAVFGGAINISGSASNNLLFGVSSFYGNYTRGVVTGFNSGNHSVWVQGSNNTIERCEIGFGSGNGITDNGTNTRVINSYVHDFNTLGYYDAVLNMRSGSNSTLNRNTLRRGGRDVIQAFNSGVISFNDVSQSNLVADDCGLIYTVGGPRNIDIHHNWFHNAYSRGQRYKAAGIYLDNDAHSINVYRNVVWDVEWTNVQINWNGTNIDIFNNTLLEGSAVMGAWHKTGTAFSDVRVWNNLSDDDSWEPQSNKQNNLTYTQNPFINKNDGDFRLKSGSQPIDFGRVINAYSVTQGYNGSAPDVGAYEFGGDNWVPGVNWNLAAGPADRCYGLPGENCTASEPPVDPQCEFPFTSSVLSITQQQRTWTTGVFNVSCASGVDVSMVAEGVGSMEDADFLNIFYRLDGGPRVAISRNTNAFPQKTVSVDDISGNTLEIIVEGQTSAAGETYAVNNITVTRASGGGGGGGGGGGSCANVMTGGQSGSFETTGVYCFKTQDPIAGWGAANFDGRTISVTVNGVGPAVTTVGATLPPKGPSDYYHFESSAGEFPWASIYWW